VPDTFKIIIDGQEVARVIGEGITPGKKSVTNRENWEPEIVDDMKLLKVVRDGKTVVVWYVSSASNISVEKVSE
jgi:hypothetical protein